MPTILKLPPTKREGTLPNQFNEASITLIPKQLRTQQKNRITGLYL
jgi:hypothetical protein